MRAIRGEKAMILENGNKVTAKEKARLILESSLDNNGFGAYEKLDIEIDESKIFNDKYQITDREKSEVERHISKYILRIGKILK